MIISILQREKQRPERLRVKRLTSGQAVSKGWHQKANQVWLQVPGIFLFILAALKEFTEKRQDSQSRKWSKTFQIWFPGALGVPWVLGDGRE